MNDTTISAMNRMVMAHHFGRTPVETDELDRLHAIYARWLNNEIATNGHEMREVISAVPRLLKAARSAHVALEEVEEIAKRIAEIEAHLKSDEKPGDLWMKVYDACYTLKAPVAGALNELRNTRAP